jgi:hypothetical protein
MNQQQWAAALLQHLGIRQTPGAMQAIVGWTRAEGGHWNNSARYNPLNTTQPEPGAGNTGTQGNIKVYKSWDQGLNATVQTLKNGRYGNILAGLSSGNPTAVGRAIERSPWGTGAADRQGHHGIVSRAKQIDAERLPYKWGGGHGATPAGRGVPLDCSVPSRAC